MTRNFNPLRSIAPDTFERVLAAGALIMLVAVIAAVMRGRDHWAEVPVMVWPHLATILIALMLTPALLLRRRGDTLHRTLGWVWAIAMTTTAALSFTLHFINRGGYSWIHILSAIILVTVPGLVIAARAHNIRFHRRSARNIVAGALLIAGFFTFPFNRLLGQWLFG